MAARWGQIEIPEYDFGDVEGMNSTVSRLVTYYFIDSRMVGMFKAGLTQDDIDVDEMGSQIADLVLSIIDEDGEEDSYDRQAMVDGYARVLAENIETARAEYDEFITKPSNEITTRLSNLPLSKQVMLGAMAVSGLIIGGLGIAFLVISIICLLTFAGLVAGALALSEITAGLIGKAIQEEAPAAVNLRDDVREAAATIVHSWNSKLEEYRINPEEEAA